MKTFIVQVNCRDGCAEVDDFDNLYIVDTDKPDVTDADIISAVRECITDVAFFESDDVFNIVELVNVQRIDHC